MSWRRLASIGLAAAAIVGLAGGLIELRRFGTSDAATTQRIAAFVQQRFAQRTAALARIDAGIASSAVTAEALQAAPDDARPLFDLLAAVQSRDPAAREIALTVYDASGVARAWAGRPSDIPQDRITGGDAYFVTRSPLGLRVVHVRPVHAGDGHRLGSVAAEQILSPAVAAVTMSASDTRFTLPTPVADVTVRMRDAAAGGEDNGQVFLLRDPGGAPLAEAEVDPAAVQRARRSLRLTIAGAVTGVCGLVLLLLAGPALDARLRARTSRAVVARSLQASASAVSAAVVWWAAARLMAGGRSPDTAPLVLGGLAAATLAAVWTQPAVRRHLALRRRRADPCAAPWRFALTQLAAGVVVAAALAALQTVIGRIVDTSTVDLRQFSLPPWNGSRLALFTGVLTLCLGALWASTLAFVAAAAAWRVPRSATRLRAAGLAAWALPSVTLAAVAATRGWPLPPLGLVGMAVACALAALGCRVIVTWYRHATMGARILVLFLAFLFPSVLLYPTVSFFTERETQRLITTRYAPEAQQHVERLKELTQRATAQIDAMPQLPATVRDASALVSPDAHAGTQLAFDVWRRTVLASQRLTSAVELYDGEGLLISRFGLNFPEYSSVGPPLAATTSCTWDLFSEAQPFGSEERNMLHAERRLCQEPPGGGPPEPVGSIVVHVMFDYRSLPFISSQSPYYELFRPSESRAPGEGTEGGNVEVAIYGWGLHPIYTSGRTAWSISDDVFARVYDVSRRPFWTRIRRGDATYEVYFSSDRSFIYALGYPLLSVFDRLVHLSELMTLAGAAYVLMLVGLTIFTRLSRARTHDGRALLREIRASFYRKLFIAFVLASIIPVLTLALVIRAYFADLLHDAVQDEAARTAAVAQRIIEQSSALVRRGATELVAGSDDVLVSIAQLIDQDVNLYEDAQLVATSERDLFASGLLPTRTPDDVYRAIVLDRRSNFVDEDQIGNFTYMLAAAPVRAGERDAMVTVPLANRQREIDREIDDLDRGVHLAALFFILAGAGIGLWLAERIADPVRRLTRATQRIAAGDFDARIAVRSADELRRLVDDFNRMAAELKAQRIELERTHRLEAWAEMARQVAHEIKNPLTPIQLSAEHLRRVHADRGEPLSPVLEGCVDTILGQVRLLRQISSEFSSFASSPVAKRAPVEVPPLVADVVEPYRTGLAGRIRIDNRVAPPLPLVEVDPTLVARALANIIENALHAMPGEGTLTLEASEDGASVVLAVTDTGMGMDAEALARTFEPYFSTKTSGTGLGMPIARRNIELSGGAIEVESARNVGTTVRIRLPIANR